MPSRPVVAQEWAKEHTTPIATGTETPNVSAFVQGDAYALPQVATVGFATVETAFNNEIDGLASASPQQMLSSMQTNAQALLQP
jgi:hypothetical protein